MRASDGRRQLHRQPRGVALGHLRARLVEDVPVGVAQLHRVLAGGDAEPGRRRHEAGVLPVDPHLGRTGAVDEQRAARLLLGLEDHRRQRVLVLGLELARDRLVAGLLDAQLRGSRRR